MHLRKTSKAIDLDLMFFRQIALFCVCFAFEEMEFKELSFLGRSLDETLVSFINLVLYDLHRRMFYFSVNI